MIAEDRQATIAQLVESQERERTRIAAEIHDDTLQALAALSIKLQLVGREVPATVTGAVGDIVVELNDASRRIRRYVSDLRPDAFEHDTLANVLRTHLVNRASEKPGIHIDLIEATDAEPPEAARITLYRIAQQAIANAFGHAEPTSVTVTVRTVGTSTEVAVADDGCGFDPTSPRAREHHGLQIMRERAELVGGRLRVDSAPGAGTTVVATVPNAIADR